MLHSLSFRFFAMAVWSERDREVVGKLAHHQDHLPSPQCDMSRACGGALSGQG